ncbi:MAG: potassium channel family protein [Bacteroidales bacterium]
MQIHTKSTWQSKVETSLNILVLIGSLAIIASLSYDVLKLGKYQPESKLLLSIQLLVCSIFLIDFFARFFMSEQKIHFLKHNFLLFFFSIPYLNIVVINQYVLTPEIHYLLGFIPLLRGGYGLIMIVKWFTGRNVTTLIVSYLSILFSFTYFASLLFFVAERNVNGMILDYWDALWWACMDMTTVGSDINAITPIGRVLSVALAGTGMMMLPIFTAYITDRISRKNKTHS